MLCPNLIHNLQQLRLQNELSLLILLARLVSLVIFPPDCLIALSAYNVTDDVPPCRHVPFLGFGRFDVDDAGEEEGFAVLATEVL